ncbi:MAG: glycosyltransferase family 2 protein [Pseudomonadota bacterium]
MSKTLSVVLPCFNEAEVIGKTFERLVSALEKVALSEGLKYQLVFVNDGSKDSTLAQLHALAKSGTFQNGVVDIISLSRNFGHQLALTAGLRFAIGDGIISIDADLQDPPEVIHEMVRLWLGGADVVYAVRKERPGETAFKLWTASLFYKALSRFTETDIPKNTGDFRLMSRRVLDIFNAMPERHRFIRGLIPWIGFKQIPYEYDRDERAAGETKYPFKRMLKLAIDAFTSFSHVPLKIAYYTGLTFALLSFVFAGWVVVSHFLLHSTVPGWSSLMVAVLVLGSLNLLVLGIHGEYIGRIYDQSKGRPIYLVDFEASRIHELPHLK